MMAWLFSVRICWKFLCITYLQASSLKLADEKEKWKLFTFTFITSSKYERHSAGVRFALRFQSYLSKQADRQSERCTALAPASGSIVEGRSFRISGGSFFRTVRSSPWQWQTPRNKFVLFFGGNPRFDHKRSPPPLLSSRSSHSLIMG